MSAPDVFARLLLEVSLRSALVLALAGLVAWLVRRGSAELRHAIWSAGVVASLLVPLALWFAPRWSLPILPARNADVLAVQPRSDQISKLAMEAGAAPTPAPEGTSRRISAIALLWLAGAGVMLLREVGGRRRLARLLRETTPVFEPGLARALRDASNHIGLTTPVECRLSSRLRVPMACGVERPIVLLPEVAADWAPAVLHDVLVHELSHLRRRDPLWLEIIALARIVYWFHPVVWLATRRMLAESERACDDAVMRAGERPSSYADTLLFVAAAAPALPEAPAALAFVRRHGLERRIHEVLRPGRNLGALGMRERNLVGTLALILGAVIAVTHPVAGSAGDRQPGATPKAESATPWREGGPAENAIVIVRNEAKAPVRVLAARAELTPGAEGDDVRIARPRLAIANDDHDRDVVAVQVSLELPTTRDRMWKQVDIAPKSSTDVRLALREWSAIVPADEARLLIVRVTGVRYSNGDAWGTEVDAPLPPPRAKSTRETKAPAPRPKLDRGKQIVISTRFPDEPSIAAPFRNPDEGSVVIVGARTPTRVPESSDGRPLTFLPAVKIENRSDLKVVGLRIRYKADAESHAVSGYEVTIEPHGAVVLQRRDFEIWGRPAEMTVQLLGARFEDGSICGTMDSTIHSRDAWADPFK